MDQAALVSWLKSGEPWGVAPKVIETHAAIVFLVGDRAFKLKKALDLGYLDFSTTGKRQQALERELALNRRTAPQLYLRVIPITHAGARFALGGAGEAIDSLLEMKRFPDGALLSELAEHGRVDAAAIEKLVRHIVRFHATAEPVVAADWPAAVRRIADENARDLRSQAPQVFDPPEVDRQVSLRDTTRSRCAGTLARQSTEVRHCHGDMHLANAFVENGEPALFDCIEFDEFYATMPPLYDFAFLLMDLCARDLTPLANRALNAWIVEQQPADWWATLTALNALPLYMSLRAEIRAKTEGRKPHGQARAKRYLRLASELLRTRPPSLIAIGGLSGTGKSTLARALAPNADLPPGAIHLRRDEIRTRLAGVRFDERLPPQSYTLEQAMKVYEAMENMSRATLSAGRTVVADAVFA